MENRKDKISKYLLIAGFILWQIVPYILHIVILKASKHSLSSFVYVLCEVVGLLILLGLGYISLKARGISSRKEIGYIGIYYISSILVGLAIRGPLGKIENKGIVLVVGLILIIIEILLIATAIMRGFCRVKITLGVVGLVLLSLIGSIIIGIVFEIIDIVIGANIVTWIIRMVLLGLLMGIIINKGIEYVGDKAPEREFKEEKIKVRVIPGLIVGVLSLVSIICILPGNRPAKRMIDLVEKKLELSAQGLMKGDIGSAIKEYDTALDYINVIRYVSDLEYTDHRLRKAMENDLMFVEYLVWEKQGNYRDIENYYENKNKDINIGIPLLDYYSSIKKEYTDKEIYEREYGEQIQGIIGQMIAENEFTNDTLSVKEIEKKGKYFEKKFEEYVISEEYLVMLEAMERVNTNGEMDWKSIEEIIACANMHPENGLIQLIAVNYGTTYKIDGGKHYEGTAECIERVVDIFSKERDKVVEADKEIYKWAIDNLLELGYYEQALGYVEKLIQVDGENEENILLAAYCKYNLGLNKECIEIVNQLPEDNYYKLYYKAASLIQEGNNQEALKEMEKLSEIVESNVSDKGDIDTLLYGLVQQVVIRDWTPAHQYGFYKPESEEYVVENEMLRLYLDAMYYMYQDKQYEQAEQAIESLLKKDSELKQVNYLAGVIHMEKGEYEEAIRYLEEVIEANPEHKAALRVISHVYDMKGDYETAYEYALRIKELVPSTDHNFDIYGVGYHNNQLLLQIERELGVER